MDVEQPGLLRARTGRWLRVRVLGLLADPKTRIFRVLRAEREPEPDRGAPVIERDIDD
ncbi:hypothetical protein OG884_26490 [Streptosporangium sp. NBC_01755]|uniref:hypothetical protein n=1 Tax=Streptosporangium sp. NBC_01755 TaxID=2975949 RepID=UPI002DDAD0AE|nr:hypothetical protein [Streptosporangium sp. NBC_01755]WSC98398.1 hypothetical protein OG884_26490 [Streptosporangium sp. NBC_01755]